MKYFEKLKKVSEDKDEFPVYTRGVQQRQKKIFTGSIQTPHQSKVYAKTNM